MDPAIVAPLHGLFGFSGGQADFVSAVADAGMQVFSFDNGDAGLYWIDTRYAPHDAGHRGRERRHRPPGAAPPGRQPGAASPRATPGSS
ncbi:MAG: uncharacterized protein JWR28_596 [Modestobacter sp.]|nr:uncharacterized protein [Modestobacter sp.]